MQHGRTGVSAQALVDMEEDSDLHHAQVTLFVMTLFTRLTSVSSYHALLMESGQIGQVGQIAPSFVGMASRNAIAHAPTPHQVMEEVNVWEYQKRLNAVILNNAQVRILLAAL